MSSSHYVSVRGGYEKMFVQNKQTSPLMVQPKTFQSWNIFQFLLLVSPPSIPNQWNLRQANASEFLLFGATLLG